MNIPIYLVDAFSDRPFSGNPAAVCILDRSYSDQWLQNVAAEMNLSETAFVWTDQRPIPLRWFTPNMEVKLCGHATLAAAYVLWKERIVSPEEVIQFDTRSGVLSATLQDSLIELNFPVEPAIACDPPEGLLEALGVSATYVGQNRFDYLAEVESEDVLQELTPNFAQLKEIDARGVIVTSESSEYDFVSRFFAPRAGVNEDPVTGSAHCCLAAYWQKKLNQSTFQAYQVSERGGLLQVRISNDRVYLGGTAAMVLRGDLCVDEVQAVATSS